LARPVPIAVSIQPIGRELTRIGCVASNRWQNKTCGLRSAHAILGREIIRRKYSVVDTVQC
jgi:hypothetical protein